MCPAVTSARRAVAFKANQLSQQTTGGSFTASDGTAMLVVQERTRSSPKVDRSQDSDSVCVEQSMFDTLEWSLLCELLL